VAGLSGLVALKILDIVVHQAKLHYFAFYCIAVSLGLVAYQLV
jgi:undecaprenyl pyrophosphate phosphatase UppP